MAIAFNCYLDKTNIRTIITYPNKNHIKSVDKSHEKLYRSKYQAFKKRK